MSRASTILIAVLVVLLVGLVVLGSIDTTVPTRPVEKDMLNAAAPR